MRAGAEKQMMEAPKARGYLPIDGIAAYDAAVKTWYLGPKRAVKSAAWPRCRPWAAPAAEVGADFLKKLNPTPRC
jgi:aromatic-amino-acid transaminase